MAFWRWATMDSWDPFSRRFWTWGNLFGQSEREYVTEVKQTAYHTLYQMISFSAPEASQSQLVCPFTRRPIQEAVVIREGLVFEKTALLRRIATGGSIPGITRTLTAEGVYDYPELKGLLDYAKARVELYNEAKASALNQARLAVAEKDYHLSYADIFRCALSKKLIKEPMLSPTGRVFDREAITAYFEKTNRNCCPVDGTPLKLSSLTLFEEMETLLALYSNRIADTKVQAKGYAKQTSNAVDVCLDFIGGIFSKPSTQTSGQATVAAHDVVHSRATL